METALPWSVSCVQCGSYFVVCLDIFPLWGQLTRHEKYMFYWPSIWRTTGSFETMASWQMNSAGNKLKKEPHINCLVVINFTLPLVFFCWKWAMVDRERKPLTSSVWPCSENQANEREPHLPVFVPEGDNIILGYCKNQSNNVSPSSGAKAHKEKVMVKPVVEVTKGNTQSIPAMFNLQRFLHFSLSSLTKVKEGRWREATWGEGQ